VGAFVQVNLALTARPFALTASLFALTAKNLALTARVRYLWINRDLYAGS
jgi:hypothetical protein